jgi:hypothetical protein
MSGIMAKGSQFERNISVQLSLWWSDGKDDSWFWRSSTSGARATQRAKQGKNTLNAAGDLAAQCAEGQKLLDLITFELKRGYPKICIADIWEKDSGGFHDFIDQARKSASLAGTRWFAVLHKRDRREPVVYIEDMRDHSFEIMAWADFLTPQNRDKWLATWDNEYAEEKTKAE